MSRLARMAGLLAAAVGTDLGPAYAGLPVQRVVRLRPDPATSAPAPTGLAGVTVAGRTRGGEYVLLLACPSEEIMTATVASLRAYGRPY